MNESKVRRNLEDAPLFPVKHPKACSWICFYCILTFLEFLRSKPDFSVWFSWTAILFAVLLMFKVRLLCRKRIFLDPFRSFALMVLFIRLLGHCLVSRSTRVFLASSDPEEMAARVRAENQVWRKTRTGGYAYMGISVGKKWKTMGKSPFFYSVVHLIILLPAASCVCLLCVVDLHFTGLQWDGLFDECCLANPFYRNQPILFVFCFFICLRSVQEIKFRTVLVVTPFSPTQVNKEKQWILLQEVTKCLKEVWENTWEEQKEES